MHRDFKPHNALIDGSGRVRVADFGLAGTLDEGLEEPATKLGGDSGPQQALTRTGALMGTPAYMAPELFRTACPRVRRAISTP